MRRRMILETTGRVDEDVTTLINWWRTKEDKRGAAHGPIICQTFTFTMVRDAFPHPKLYSKDLWLYYRELVLRGVAFG